MGLAILSFVIIVIISIISFTTSAENTNLRTFFVLFIFLPGIYLSYWFHVTGLFGFGWPLLLGVVISLLPIYIKGKKGRYEEVSVDSHNVAGIANHAVSFISMCHKVSENYRFPVYIKCMETPGVIEIWGTHIFNSDHIEFAYDKAKRNDSESVKWTYKELCCQCELTNDEKWCFQDWENFLACLSGKFPNFNYCELNGNQVEIHQNLGCMTRIDSRNTQVLFDLIVNQCNERFEKTIIKRFGHEISLQTLDGDLRR